MTARTDRWIRRTTIACVGLLALIAGTVSYLHMHLLVELHGQPGWVAALTPLSVDGMIMAASTTLLAESRSGMRGGYLPWVLLVTGSVASLAANVAVAEPTATSRVIAAWPSFALIASYELLMRQVRRAAQFAGSGARPERSSAAAARASGPAITGRDGPDPGRAVGPDVQREAWRWAQSKRAEDGSLPSGRDIGVRYGRHERRGAWSSNPAWPESSARKVIASIPFGRNRRTSRRTTRPDHGEPAMIIGHLCRRQREARAQTGIPGLSVAAANRAGHCRGATP